MLSNLPFWRGPAACLLGGLLLALFAPALSAQGTMVHTLEAFHAPAAVVALPDGRTLFVSNSGRGNYGLLAGRGSISRVTLGSDDHLKVEKLRFIEGLNGPIAMTLLASGSDTLPANTLVVTVGGSWMVDAGGRPLPDDDTRGTGLVLFDPETGESRGQIQLGVGSEAEKVLGHPVADPTALTSDPAGNLYLIDVDGAATRAHRRGDAHVGIIKITRVALDAMSRGETPPDGSMLFAVERSIPTALLYSSTEDALYWGTFGGELRRVAGGDLSGRTAVVTVAKELSSIGTLGLTPNDTIIGVSADGYLFSIRGRKARPIKFRRESRFLSAGQPAIVRGADQRTLIVLPEQGGGGVGPWRQRVNVIALPGGY